MPTLSFPLPLVESGHRYAAASLAQEITNLRMTPDGVLESVRGPMVLIPDYGSGYPYGSGRAFGVYHALLDSGTRDVTLIRFGQYLYEQAGWARSVQTIASGLSTDPNARVPDQFVEVAGKIVWTNGIDRPLAFDGYVSLPLGYTVTPGAPGVLGPGDDGHPVFRNAGGYSHPGRLGTVGNFFAAGQGQLLAGGVSYYVQFEDAFGNRSPLSPASAQVAFRQEFTAEVAFNDYDTYPNGATTDLGLLTVTTGDLTRQAAVVNIPTGPTGTVARILYRTPDAALGIQPPRFIARIPDNVTTDYPDNTPDAALGAEPPDYIALPKFHAMCAHQGCLVVLEGRNVSVSEPGFPGTFRRDSFVPLDNDGAEPSGVFSHAGVLYAATTSSLFRIDQDTEGRLYSRRIEAGPGLVGPNAVDSTPFGALGLSFDGFWLLDGEGQVKAISNDIYPTVRRLNPSQLAHACIRWSPSEREVLCAVPVAGAYGNSLVLTWDGGGWRRREYGIAFESLAVTKDWRRDVLAAGTIIGDDSNVFVLTAETQTFSPPQRTARFRSQWLRMDPTGRCRFDVTRVFVGIVETCTADLTWTVWQNGTRDTAVSTGTFQACSPATTAVLDTFIVGDDKARTPRLVWKEAPVRVRSADCFAFDVACEEPARMALAAFAFEGQIADAAGARVSRQ